MTAYTTAALLGIFIAGGILLLVRRDRLHGTFAIWWLLIAIGALVLGFFPTLIDWLGARFGVRYPPILLVLVVLAALLLKLLALDIDITRRERRMRRLLQKFAILEEELRRLRDQTAAPPRPGENSEPANLPASSSKTPRKTAG